MRLLKLFLIVLLFTSCKDDVNSSQEIIFHQDDISELSIQDLSEFWNGDSVYTEKIMEYILENYEGYLGGLGYRTENFKTISVNVFKSSEIAIEAMEYYRSNISAMSAEGDSNEIIKEKWWYVVGTNNKSIWVNKNNTILFVSNTLSDDENVSISTAAELISRVEALSK